MNDKYWNLPSIIFNIIESLLLVLVAKLLKIGMNNLLIIFLTFQISRSHFRLPKHYKQWQQCLIWTLLIFVSLFVIARVDIIIGVLVTIFAGYLLSGDGDIKDIYMWKGKNSNYDELLNFISISPNNPMILDYENYWRNYCPIRFQIFIMFYRERKSYDEIREYLGYENNNKIKEECKIIYEQLQRPLNLSPL